MEQGHKVGIRVRPCGEDLTGLGWLLLKKGAMSQGMQAASGSQGRAGRQILPTTSRNEYSDTHFGLQPPDLYVVCSHRKLSIR